MRADRATLDLDEFAQPRPKVFGIGLHKTSTSSLAAALYTLDYEVTGFFDVGAFEDREQLDEYVVDAATRFDAVQDMPWPAFYRELDERFPGAKFILTVRDPKRWFDSVETHFGMGRYPSHEFFYGVPTATGYADTYLEYFERHEREVKAYFAERPDDLLVMDISAGDGWEALCGFLGRDVPPVPFPSQNKRSGRQTGRYRRYVLRRADLVLDRLGVGWRPPSNVVNPYDAFTAIHWHCELVSRLVNASDALEGHDQALLRAMLSRWLSQQLEVLASVGVEVAADPDDPSACWTECRPVLRNWAGNLDFETIRVPISDDGRSGGDLTRAIVNGGQGAYAAIVEVMGQHGVAITTELAVPSL